MFVGCLLRFTVNQVPSDLAALSKSVLQADHYLHRPSSLIISVKILTLNINAAVDISKLLPYIALF